MATRPILRVIKGDKDEVIGARTASHSVCRPANSSFAIPEREARNFYAQQRERTTPSDHSPSMPRSYYDEVSFPHDPLVARAARVLAEPPARIHVSQPAVIHADKIQTYFAGAALAAFLISLPIFAAEVATYYPQASKGNPLRPIEPSKVKGKPSYIIKTAKLS